MKRLGYLLALPFLWLWNGRRGVAAAVSLAAIGVGCWMAWKPMGLIVPGGLVLLLLVVSRIAGKG